MSRLVRLVFALSVGATCLLGSPHAAAAQTPARQLVSSGTPESIPALPIRYTVEEAEAEGATFPKSRPDSLRVRLFARYDGSADRKCVRLPNMVGRVGDFVVSGPIAASISVNNEPSPVRWKGWWMSAHDPTIERNGLLVRGARIRSDGVGPDSLRYVDLTYAYSNVGRTPVAQFRQPLHEPPANSHYNTAFFYPSDGDWLLIVTSGSDWSCYIVKYRRPT